MLPSLVFIVGGSMAWLSKTWNKRALNNNWEGQQDGWAKRRRVLCRKSCRFWIWTGNNTSKFSSYFLDFWCVECKCGAWKKHPIISKLPSYRTTIWQQRPKIQGPIFCVIFFKVQIETETQRNISKFQNILVNVIPKRTD